MWSAHRAEPVADRQSRIGEWWIAACLTASRNNENQIESRIATGRWEVIRRGVYRIAGTPTSYPQTVHAACLAVGERGMGSHLTAAAVWGLATPAPDALDILTPLGPRVRLEGIRHHRSTNVHVDDITRRQCLPVTTVARTLVDVAKLFRPKALGHIVDDAERRRLVRLADLRRCHERLARSGRARATMAEVLASRAPGRDPGGSERELWVIGALQKAGLPIPVQQHRVRLQGRTYFLDLAYPDLKIAIEFDGWDTHRTFRSFHGDRRRTRLLVAAGWIVIPVTARVSGTDLAVMSAQCWRALVTSPADDR